MIKESELKLIKELEKEIGVGWKNWDSNLN